MRYKAVVAYDGTAYNGWQRQINGTGIQALIEQALEKLAGIPTEIVASGRTDAGVHALGQVFHFDMEKLIDGYHIKLAINSMLPQDIRILSVEQTTDDFHARFDAVSKRYEYRIGYGVDDPFRVRYMALEKEMLDIEAMRESAQVLCGTHDFTSFTSAKIDPRKPRIRTITRLEIVEEHDGVRMIFEGDGFLRYQVRMMSATLMEVGKHHLSKQDVTDILNGKDKHLCRYNAKPQGLYLVSVTYPK